MATQSIKRSNLKEIYDSVGESCSWRKKIQDLILWSDEGSIKVSDELIEKGYNEANSDQKKIIEKYFKINTPKKIIEQVKDFDDILKIAELTLEEVIPYKKPKSKREISINAYAKLQLVGEVLNGAKEEDWIDWENSNQSKYYPWLEYKKAHSDGYVLSSYYYHYYFSHAVAAYFKTSELALFAGKTFMKEYKEFLSR